MLFSLRQTIPAGGMWVLLRKLAILLQTFAIAIAATAKRATLPKKVGAQPVSCLAKYPCKNRVDMAQMVTKIELCLDFSRGKGSAHLSVGL